jgi:hypothetical protein
LVARILPDYQELYKTIKLLTMAQDEQDNIGTWNAWTGQKDGHAHLFVEGELPANSQEADVRLVKAEPQGSDERDLLLTIVPRVQLDNPDRTLQFTYNEALRDEHQYASITITDQGNPVARIVSIGRKELA